MVRSASQNNQQNPFQLQARMVLVIMDDIDRSGNKTFRIRTSNDKNKDIESPIKKCHYLEGKHFIVIDKSITEKLNFFDPDNTELYFEQGLTEAGCIILRPFIMRH